MLQINKSLMLTASIMREGVQVVWLTASLNTEGSNCTSINKTITNQELYNADRESIRAEIEEFEQAVYSSEDNIILLNEKSTLEEI